MWLAWLGAIAIGVSLGLLGSGGSIITVPVLVYLLDQPEKLAIAGSLAVVGAIALAGALQAAVRRQVQWRAVAWFGLPGMLGTQAGAWLGRYASGATQLVLFAVVMLAAAVLMFRGGGYAPAQPHGRAAVALQGTLVGTLTGFVGVGGGFMIVPALVLLLGVPVHLAIGTSLMIISLNAWSGFAGHWWQAGAAGLGLDWPLLAKVAVLGIAGSIAGTQVARRMPQQMLRRVFAVLLTALALYMLATNLPRLAA